LKAQQETNELLREIKETLRRGRESQAKSQVVSFSFTRFA
jgi:hypothetical protein